MRLGLRITLWRSIAYIWWREYRYQGFQFANRRTFGHHANRNRHTDNH